MRVLLLSSMGVIVLALGAGFAAHGGPAPRPTGTLAFVVPDPVPGELAFPHDVWTVRPDGSGRRRVAGGLGSQEAPAWSPDGRMLAYEHVYEPTSAAPVTSDVFVVGVNGRGRRRVTVGQPWGSVPAWAPDGGRIAFAASDGGGLDGIAVVAADGSGLRRLTSGWDLYPVWSPDGRELAFVRTGDIYVVGADAGPERRLTGTGFDSSPVWSPDGRWLAFARVVEEERLAPNVPVGIHLVPARGGITRRLTRLPDGLPAWSPDGSRLAFARGATPRTAGIHVLGLDGRGLRRLTRGYDTRPTWSPDGRWIAFERLRPAADTSDLWVMRSDGTAERNVTRTPRTDERDLSWQPSPPSRTR